MTNELSRKGRPLSYSESAQNCRLCANRVLIELVLENDPRYYCRLGDFPGNNHIAMSSSIIKKWKDWEISPDGTCDEFEDRSMG